MSRRPSGRQLPGTLLDWLLPRVARFYTRLWHQCRWVRPSRLPSGPVVVVANHPSHADASFLMAGYGRRIHFLHAREQCEVFLMRHFFRLCGCIPVTRGAVDIAAVRLALQRLERGAAIGVFPEGEVETPGQDRVGPGRTGAALLALRSGAVVVPAFIDGGRDSGILADWLLPAGKVRVIFGEPVCLDRYRKLPFTRDRLREVTDLLMARIEELRPCREPAAKPN